MPAKKKSKYSSGNRKQKILDKCFSGPSSSLCRRHVATAADEMRATKRKHIPRAGKLSKKALVLNSRGKYVSRAKSRLGRARYPGSKLQVFNEMAKKYMAELESEDEYSDEEDEDPKPVATPQRRSQRAAAPRRRNVIEGY